MVSEPDTGRCASEEAEPRKGWPTRRCAGEDTRPRREVDWRVPHRLEKETNVSEDTGFRRGWIVRSHVGRRREGNILYKGCGNLALADMF